MTEKQIASIVAQKTIFNPKWSDGMIKRAVENGVKSALKADVTDGEYIFKYLGEKVIIEMRDGILQTAYGAYKVTKEMLR